MEGEIQTEANLPIAGVAATDNLRKNTMARPNPKLKWCVIELGEDTQWWVTEISDDTHWDVDGLGIIDPKQIAHIIDVCEPLREYGFDPEIIDQAFFAFVIEKETKGGGVRLARTRESLIEGEESAFALPDVMDDSKGPYADFLDQITRARVKLLNDLIEFDQNLTIEELEEDIRERQNAEYFEGRPVHFFNEITAILEYVPEGYELDSDDEEDLEDDDDLDDIPDIEVDEESIVEDDTMKWDEDEEEEDEDEDSVEDLDDLDDEEEDDEEAEEEDESKSSGTRRSGRGK